MIAGITHCLQIWMPLGVSTMQTLNSPRSTFATERERDREKEKLQCFSQPASLIMHMCMLRNAELAKDRLAAILYRCHPTPIVVTRRFVSPNCQMLGSRVVSIFARRQFVHAVITRSIVADAAQDSTKLIMRG